MEDYHKADAQLSNPDIDWSEFENDYQARVNLETRLAKLYKIVHSMESTKILHDYDNFQAALQDYAFTQFKKHTDAPGFSKKYDDLKVFFPRGPQAEPDSEPEPEPET